MNKELEKKLKIKGWWEHIPVIGNMIYAIRVEMWLNNLDEENKLLRKNTKKYKTIFNLTSFLISISFLITFFVLRNTNSYGAFPWFFWVGLSFGIAGNISPLISKHLYTKGYQLYIKNNKN